MKKVRNLRNFALQEMTDASKNSRGSTLDSLPVYNGFFYEWIPFKRKQKRTNPLFKAGLFAPRGYPV